MSNYMVEAKSRIDLRKLARILRKHLNLDDELYFPIVELLDVFTEIFDDFNYEVVEDTVLSKKVHADTDIRTGHIRIKESVYIGNGNHQIKMENPGRVPGSKAIYYKIIDPEGKTIRVYKETYDPDGNLVHVKEK